MSNKEEKTTLQQQVEAELKSFTPEDIDSEDNSEVSVKSETSEQEIESSEVSKESTEVSTADVEDPYLQEALSMGYKPNYQGPNKKTPEQFVKDGSFFKKIDELKKENQEVKNILKQQIEHAKKVEQAAAEKQLKEIQAAKRLKIEEADVPGHDLLEAQEQIVQKQLQELKQQDVTPAGNQVTDAVKGFIEKNKEWCNFNTDENRMMAEDADLEARKLASRNPGKSETEILEMVEARIKRDYPHRFKNPNISKPAAVARSTTTKEVSSSALLDKLNSRQRAYLQKAREYGCPISAEDYIKQLKLTGEFRDE